MAQHESPAPPVSQEASGLNAWSLLMFGSERVGNACAWSREA